jgi:hypothetical protein
VTQEVAQVGNLPPWNLRESAFHSSGMCRDASLNISRNLSNAARVAR